MHSFTFITEGRSDLPYVVSDKSLQSVRSKSVKDEGCQGGAKSPTDHVTYRDVGHVGANPFLLRQISRLLKLNHDLVEGGAYLRDDHLLCRVQFVF